MKISKSSDKYPIQLINQSFISETYINRQDSDIGNIPVSQDSKAEKPALIGTH